MAKKTYTLPDTYLCNELSKHIPETDNIATLPLTFKLDWKKAEDIFETGYIPVEECDVFMKAVSYFFYGKPEYPIAQGKRNRRSYLYYPVCFIFDLNSLAIKWVFPFDSGAYADERYESYIHEAIDITEFLVEPTEPRIRGFIKFFFENNENYFTNKQKQLEIDTEHYPRTINSIINLYNSSGGEQFDSRAYTVEAISPETIDFARSVKAIVIPSDFQTAFGLKEKVEILANMGIDILTYPVIGNDPESYNSNIDQIIYKYYKDNHLFD